MPLKAVVLDVSGTLIVGDRPVDGVVEMIERLRNLGLRVITVSYRSEGATKARSILGMPYDEAISQLDVDYQNKGTRAYIAHICRTVRCERHELIYLGDSERDMREAVNSHVLYFTAEWANPGYRYGLPVETPDQFASIIEAFFQKDTLWYYQLQGTGQSGRTISVRALMDPDVARHTGLTDLLKNKGQGNYPSIRGYAVEKYLTYHLLASIYLEGLLLRQGSAPIWCLYPGSGGAYGSALDHFASLAARLFHDKYWPGLIVRHTPVASSSQDRRKDQPPSIERQLRSIHLDPEREEELYGRSVIVLDDFTTEAHAFETARLYLQHAGVRDIVCIAVGKYSPRGYGRQYYMLRHPRHRLELNCFAPNPSLQAQDFDNVPLRGTISPDAMKYF